ncbi:MAG: Stp1/IreP family PP2C-type Ser/Thr phosphatase [Oscillospiraceae bacterium]
MDIYGMTDIGLKRETNQDVFYTHKFSEQVGFAIVCDGMGGQNGGNVASEMACQTISHRLMESNNIVSMSDDEIKSLVISATSGANIEVYKTSNIEPGYKGMGTTVVIAVVSNKKAYIAHIGDSRVYLLREGKLHQLTRDHSVVQELLEQGKISQDEAKVHPNKNMITRAVGVNLTVDIDYLEVLLGQESKLLLCSDGLTNMVSDQIIEKTLRKYNPEATCTKLIELSNKAGGVDNITVAVME